MQEIIDSYKNTNNLHHAYFLVGEVEGIFSELKDFLENKVSVKTSGNPDFWHGKFDNFSIDEAREVVEKSLQKDFSGGKKIFIIQTDFITSEAQNSLLKVFEEPTFGTHFFIISPQDILLPTLRSRVQFVRFGNIESDGKYVSIINMNFKQRLEEVKKITEAISDEEATKQEAVSFLDRVERELYKNGVENSGKELEVCMKTREALFDRGAPIKMILENLMLSI
jgi:DNA polymerase III delta prime subunit